MRSRPDQHFIDAIKENTEEIAVAVYPVGRTERQLRDEMEGFIDKFPLYHLRFFDVTTVFQAD